MDRPKYRDSPAKAEFFMSTDIEAPISFPPQTVLPEWVDFNGHMNVAFYMVAFDRCVDVMYNRLGIGPQQLPRSNRSLFTLEAHISYLREVMEGQALTVTGRLLDYDHKRVHAYFEMFHGRHGHPVAAMEQIGLHVDLTSRKPASFDEEVMPSLAAMLEAHRHLTEARYAGRVIRIPRR